MSFENEKEEIKRMLESVENNDVRFKIERAIECLNDPPRHRIVTEAVALTRKNGFLDLSLSVANLAYEINPDNAYFLVELTRNLIWKRKTTEAIEKFKEYLSRVDTNTLTQKEREMVVTSYASALKEKADFEKAIDIILKNLSNENRQAIELLSDLYNLNDQPDKTVELLQKRDKLSSTMAYNLAKALKSLNRPADALQVAEQHSTDNKIKKLLPELQRGSEIYQRGSIYRKDDQMQQANKENQNQENIMISKINMLEKPMIRDKALFVVKNLKLTPPDEKQSKTVTSTIKEIRRYGNGIYKDFALDLAKYAYEINPSNPFFLGELCVLLNSTGKYQNTIDEIKNFMNRMEQNGFHVPAENKDYLFVNLALAYDGLGKSGEGIELLLKSGSKADNVQEALARLYYNDGKPTETINLLENRETITEKMAIWLAKSYIALSRWEDARRVAEKFGLEDLRKESQGRRHMGVQPTSDKLKRVWIIHGRNGKLAKSISDFLLSIGLEPIEWSEARYMTKKPNPSISEIVQTGFDYAQAFVVLLTGDDEAKLRDGYIKPDDPEWEGRLTPQARPNVLFEAGMAFGLDENKVIFVRRGRLRPFSDIGGKHLIELDNTTESRKMFANSLKNAGCDVADLMKKDNWIRAGDLELD